MNKKIVMSLSVIAAVSAVVIGGTGAFFSDSETSTGNTFTAGAIDLKVDSEQHYNGHECIPNPNELTATNMPYVWGPGTNPYPVEGTACDGTWKETDLGAQKFFNFTDVKPGDSGENTISLHVINNDAWACVDVAVTKNDDMSSTEPELYGTGDVLDTVSTMDGELAQNVYFTAWADDGDNVWESGEMLLFSNDSGPASDVLGGKTYALADATTGLPMPGSDDASAVRYIGLAWCAGMQTVDTNNYTIGCSNASMGNDTQTDSLEASVAFRVVQARNNPNFYCDGRVVTGPNDVLQP